MYDFVQIQYGQQIAKFRTMLRIRKTQKGMKKKNDCKV